jgi:hypothetical protein
MKNSTKTILFSLILIGFITFAKTTSAQAPPPPPAEKGTNSNKAPSAPLDSGLGVIIAMVAGFGAWKMYKKLHKA